MTEIIPSDTASLVRSLVDAPDETVLAMEEYGAEHGPTTVGREVGQLLRLLTALAGARRVFEFGSGYGYSAYWFALGTGTEGEVVLTDRDEGNIARAREFFEAGGIDDRARFEVGDAHEVFAGTDGPFDVVLLDHDKTAYGQAYREARDRIEPGGLLIADNAMVSTSIDFDDLRATVEGDTDRSLNESTAEIASYLTTVRDDAQFETVLLPIGEGVAVSRKRGFRES
jgi:predicted O-methyltransferase YrrM